MIGDSCDPTDQLAPNTLCKIPGRFRPVGDSTSLPYSLRILIQISICIEALFRVRLHIGLFGLDGYAESTKVKTP